MNDFRVMGVDSKRRGAREDTRRRYGFRTAGARRLGFFALVLATAAIMTTGMAEIQMANGLEVLEVAILLLFAANIFWVALAAWTAVAGVLIEAFGLDPVSLRRCAPLCTPADGALETRTAVIMPIRHEDPARVAAAFEAMAADLAGMREEHAFDLWLLSGSTRPDVIAAERTAWAALTARLNPRQRAYYWKRDDTAGRKAGLITDYLRRWGGHYDFMVVLDADSLMAGTTLVALARLMEANPTVGLIQTLPQPVGQTTVFGRLLQFASHLYGPVFASGAAFWQMGEGNYYGHNAIIRVAAFAQHAALPELPGAPPLGGEILSHDFVEAALLRRAGWRVVSVPWLTGSYEELPSNVLDYAARDRRWCQGNLQHLRIFGWPGLHPVSRLHLFSGAFAFIASPVWLLFLLLSTASMVEQAVFGHDYFPGGYRLFPDWPVSRWTESVSLFAVTLILLFLPKILALALALMRRDQRRRFGGARRLLLGSALETVFSMLLAPIMMALHTNFIGALLAGRSVGWNAQNRSGRGLSLAEAGSRLGVLFLFAVAWGVLMGMAAPDRLWWILPVLSGLALSVPVAMVTSRNSVAGGTGAAALLATPPETEPDTVLLRAAVAAAASPAPAQATPAADDLPLPPFATPARTSHQGHGLRGAITPTGQKTYAAWAAGDTPQP